MFKLIGCLLLLLPLWAISQEAKKENPVTFYGFVRSDFYLDTYKGVNAFQDIFYLFPNYIGVDANGKDINNQSNANLLSVVTRGGVIINGPDIFGAKTTGCIEVDFAGKPEIFLVRLRKAYTLFSWEKTKLLVGQTWHPFWGNDAFPRVGALNSGTPFQPFNRSPQVRFDYRTGGLTFSVAALYQQQYVSVGPVGSSSMYKRDAVIPESVLSLEYTKKKVTLGAGVDFNKIKPRVTTSGTNKQIYVSDQSLNSTSWMAYGKYSGSKLMMLLKGYYGQNMAHLTMIGGYGVSSYDPVTGAEKYTNFSSYSALLNVTYGIKWKPGLLVGYLENLGSKDPLAPLALDKDGKANVWGLGTNIMNMYRVSPSVSYSVPKFLLTAEYEMTRANYGDGLFSFNDGLYSEKHAATNYGVRLIMTYYF
jgi:hypothetical protein